MQNAPLYAVAFTSGAVMMSLQLAGARMLAPVMGNSIFVWGSVISSFMFALAIGYWLGGMAADRYGSRRTLGMVVGAAGLFTVLAPLVAEVTFPAAAALGPRMGALVAAASVFVAPALLMAMVSPIGVRAASSAGLGHIGRTAGSLYAVSTAGSIIGTLATSFWLIPAVQVGPLIVGAGMVLAASAMLTFALPPSARHAQRELAGRSWARGVAALSVAAVLAGALGMGGALQERAMTADGAAILFERDTEYHHVLVTESDGVRTLQFNRSRQTAVSVDDPTVSRLRYTDYLHLALAVKPDAERVLVLGLGGGALSARMLADYPGMSVDAVEIDPVVVDVARRFFALPEDDRLDVHVMDARRWVQQTSERYDIIVVDCYYEDAIPFHLMTQEFFEELDAVLEPGGVVAYNLISAVEGGRSDLFRSLYRTAGTVWGQTWVFPVERRDGQASLELTRNIVLLTSDSEVSQQVLLERVRSRIDGRVTVPGFERFGERLHTGLVEQADVPLLTDAYAPTDSLIRVD